MANEPRAANRLEQLREDAGISRPAIADLVGVGEHQVRRWEANEVLIPTKHLEALTEKFGVSVEYLMGWDREPAAAGKAAA
jgi:transcriptional regulator with XRE-family HTH domain